MAHNGSQAETAAEELHRLRITVAASYPPSPWDKAARRIVQFDIQSIYAQMFECGLSARTIEYTNAVLQSALRQAVR